MTAPLRKTWQLLTPDERKRALSVMLLSILMAATEAAGVLSIMPFLSVLGRPDIIDENAWLSSVYTRTGLTHSRDFILWLGMASIMIVVASSIFKSLAQHAINRFVHLLRHSISTRLLERYLQQPYAFFLGRNTADLNKNILSEVDQLLFNLLQPVAQMIAQGAVVSIMAILIILYDPIMAAGILAMVATLYAVIYGVVRRRLSRMGTERLSANRDRYQAANEALGGIKEVKITHSSHIYTEQFRRASRLYSRHLATNDTLSQTPLYLVEAVGYTGLILISLTLLFRTEDIAQVLPALGLYGFAAYRMLPAAQIIYRGFSKLRFSSPAITSLHHDLMLPTGITKVEREPIRPHHEIQLKGVKFAYPSSPGTPVLDNLSLSFPANASTGIVGESGSGKSTLMDILLGLLRPQAGTLRVDGILIDEENVEAWQKGIGYVPQHVYLSDASVIENIAFGVSRADVDIEAVHRAARIAQIHHIIENELPDGYATMLGDRGIRLSGGQRQRIGIARALYRDPPVLFFDEATSALDANTENALNDAISQLSGKKTIIVIAHKEQTIRRCNRIFNLSTRHTSFHGEELR